MMHAECEWGDTHPPDSGHYRLRIGEHDEHDDALDTPPVTTEVTCGFLEVTDHAEAFANERGPKGQVAVWVEPRNGDAFLVVVDVDDPGGATSRPSCLPSKVCEVSSSKRSQTTRW